MKITRNFDILDQMVEKYNNEKALSVKRNGKWEYFSTNQYKQYADELSYGLLEMGFKKGDKILTMSNNRPEWNFVDMGMGQIGVAHVPVYTNLSDKELLYVIKHSDAKIVITSTAEFYVKIKALVEDVPEVENVFMFDDISGAPSWLEIVELGRDNKE
ncbi:MAG: AMP-binding protein, partial [Bacteroidota bacterium]|nr:AMP-binding protein [Bacteroidota bacterium]